MHWSFGLVLACALALSAQASLIKNGSFENPVSPNTPALDTGSTYLDGWTVLNSVWRQLFFPAYCLRKICYRSVDVVQRFGVLVLWNMQWGGEEFVRRWCHLSGG